jgi:serine phosphatase RsbU (regulator of sigma subunit)
VLANSLLELNNLEMAAHGISNTELDSMMIEMQKRFEHVLSEQAARHVKLLRDQQLAFELELRVQEQMSEHILRIDADRYEILELETPETNEVLKLTD